MTYGAVHLDIPLRRWATKSNIEALNYNGAHDNNVTWI